mgnify:CR=1 FL=1
MQTITIHGRRTLHGSIRPAAAKNSTLPVSYTHLTLPTSDLV